MAIETERKFLVTDNAFLQQAVRQERIVQGYLSKDPARTVRVRIKGERGYLTVKGAGDPAGVSRNEWEYEIPAADAREMLALCCGNIVDKTRHIVLAERHTFEVDVFHGSNDGLILAEIELSRPDEVFERPDWLGREVTGQARYYNSALSVHPYGDWEKTEK